MNRNITEKNAAAIRQKERDQKKAFQKTEGAEARMLRYIRRLSILFCVIAPLAVSGVIGFSLSYIDNDLLSLYDFTSLLVLYWVLYYVMRIAATVYQYAGFGLLGYTVMRYGMKKAWGIAAWNVVSATIGYVCSVVMTIYSYGSSTIQSELSYYVSYWVINYFLAIFTTLCVIILCAFLRASFRHRGRLAVGLTKEDKEKRKKNVLRKLYIFIILLLLLFNMVPAIMNMIMEIKKAGAPDGFWDVFTLLDPLIRILLASVLGYFVLLMIGNGLTNKDADIREAIISTEAVIVPADDMKFDLDEKNGDGNEIG